MNDPYSNGYAIQLAASKRRIRLQEKELGMIEEALQGCPQRKI
ncbi:hypothetical protein [Pseudomonas fluorescens]|nr:hypothetical protein [Pseudomonas fluorescens]